MFKVSKKKKTDFNAMNVPGVKTYLQNMEFGGLSVHEYLKTWLAGTMEIASAVDQMKVDQMMQTS